MKYWQGVNFGDWRFLDKIANIESTNKNYITENMCHFLHQVATVKLWCRSIKEKHQTKSFLTIKAGFIIRVPSSTRVQLYTLLQAELARNSTINTSTYSVKERMDAGKYFTEVVWLPYLLHHLGNTCALK